MAVYAAHTHRGRMTVPGLELAQACEKLKREGWASCDRCLIGAANVITIFGFARYLNPDAFVGFMLGYAGLLVALFLQSRADRDQPSSGRFTSAFIVLQVRQCIGMSLGLALAGCAFLAAGHKGPGGVVIAVALAALPCLGQDLVRRVLHARGGARGAALSDGLTYGLQIFGALVLVSAAAKWSTAGSALSVLGLSSAVGLAAGCWQLRRQARFEAGGDRYPHEAGAAWG